MNVMARELKKEHMQKLVRPVMVAVKDALCREWVECNSRQLLLVILVVERVRLSKILAPTVVVRVMFAL